MPLLAESTYQQAVEICRSLVAIPSLAGEEAAAITCARDWMQALGYADIRIDECGNLIGALHGEGDHVVLYDAHIDTVGAGDLSAWTYDPFGGAVVDDRLYGRGTSDMKGALAAMIVGLATAHADGSLRGTALVSATVGEEHIEGLAMGRAVECYRPDLVIIGEASALKLNIAQRGRAEINVTTHGKSAHASSPQIGVNALRHMALLITALDQITPPTHPLLGAGILEPTGAISAPYPSVSVIPYRCDVRYDRRTLTGESDADVLAPIRAVIDQLAAQHADFRADAQIVDGSFTCYTGLTLHQATFAPAWELLRDDAWVRVAQNALGNVELGIYKFCTNGSYSRGRAGIPTLGYGPGYEHSAHIVNEYLDLAQLFGAVDGYYRLGGMTTA